MSCPDGLTAKQPLKLQKWWFVRVCVTPDVPVRRDWSDGLSVALYPAQDESAILKCLEKDPSNRPQSARELEEMLAAVQFDKHWSLKKAEQWWNSHLPERVQ